MSAENPFNKNYSDGPKNLEADQIDSNHDDRAAPKSLKQKAVPSSLEFARGNELIASNALNMHASDPGITSAVLQTTAAYQGGSVVPTPLVQLPNSAFVLVRPKPRAAHNCVGVGFAF